MEAEKKAKVDKEKEKEVLAAKSIFHGGTLRDYLGRTFVDHPSHLKPAEHECFLPKRIVHTWYV